MAEKKVKEYVAYTPLGSYQPGDTVNPRDSPLQEWQYMDEHTVVVPKNSADDPNVLEETAAEREAEGRGHVGANVAAPRELTDAERAHKASTEGCGGQEKSEDDKSKPADKPANTGEKTKPADEPPKTATPQSQSEAPKTAQPKKP